MTLEEMKQKKQEFGYSYAQLSELSGVPETTIQKIFSGTTSHPRFATLQALEKVLAADRLREGAIDYSSGGHYLEKGYYPNQGSYTIEDRDRLPDDWRTELIDGVIYDMASPVIFHQHIAGEAYFQARKFIESKGGGYVPFMAPLDVQLDRDNRTMVQPDMIIVSDPDWTRKNIFGAPDFVLEVISPSTGKKDYMLKLSKYEHAGVREYWIVDPYQHLITTYFFEDETSCPVFYHFEDHIPVRIYNGELKINFASMIPLLPESERK